MPVADFAERSGEEKFDVIIADPPYDQVNEAEIANLGKLLSDDGILALSHPAKQPVPKLDDLELLSSKTYAGATISFYKKPSKVLL